MRKSGLFLCLALFFAMLVLSGCATQKKGFEEEREYSDMPWNTPQQWEGSRQIPGMQQPSY